MFLIKMYIEFAPYLHKKINLGIENGVFGYFKADFVQNSTIRRGSSGINFFKKMCINSCANKVQIWCTLLSKRYQHQNTNIVQLG